MIQACILLCFFLILSFELLADDHHSIKGFYGERAAGMGGAFAGISDDPSGMFYNPAGLSFMQYDFLTTSSLYYKNTKETYTEADGIDKDYVRASSVISPNFIGSVKSYGKIKFGFSVINNENDKFDQEDELSNPINSPSVKLFRVNYNETTLSYLFGPSIAYSINDRFSIGLSLLGFYDNSKVSYKILKGYKNSDYRNQSTDIFRDTRGVIPIVGIQKMIGDYLSWGTSIRKPFAVIKRGKTSSVYTNNQTTSTDLVSITSGNEERIGGNTGANSVTPSNYNFTGKSPLSASIPEPVEIRTGFGLFPSRYVAFSFDLIYTGSYKKPANLYVIDPFQKMIGIPLEREYKELCTRETLNYAFGFEYFITEKLIIRLGHFTNQSNSKRLNASNSLSHLILYNTYPNMQTDSGNILFNFPAFEHNLSIDEHINLKGYSIGFGLDAPNSSLNITYILEQGRGTSLPFNTSITEALYKESKFYLSATLKE
ncbi:MAG: outer membrane protein transport protein [Leptospiraceae bacterium]|nr:outer membrane protein transport protein [Leptospiraceae bacterium]